MACLFMLLLRYLTPLKDLILLVIGVYYVIFKKDIVKKNYIIYIF